MRYIFYLKIGNKELVEKVKKKWVPTLELKKQEVKLLKNSIHLLGTPSSASLKRGLRALAPFAIINYTIWICYKEKLQAPSRVHARQSCAITGIIAIITDNVLLFTKRFRFLKNRTFGKNIHYLFKFRIGKNNSIMFL